MIYAGDGCAAPLPDYIPLVAVSDNCSIASVTQTPTAGFILNSTTQSTTVKIRATDVFGNWTEVSFHVTLVDTVKPVITWDGEAIAAANWNIINSIYDQADRLLAAQETYFDTHFDWEASGIPEDLRPINQYGDKMLVTWTSPGTRERLFTFVSPNDTFVIK